VGIAKNTFGNFYSFLKDRVKIRNNIIYVPGLQVEESRTELYKKKEG
jgi:hypothetical protein